MGGHSSTPSKTQMLNQTNNYRKEYLKERWKDTAREWCPPKGGGPPGEGYTYTVGYAPTGAATCRGCQQKIAKGALRIGRSSPNPFDAEGGASDYSHFFHASHAFPALLRSRCTSRVPAAAKDLAGWEALTPADKAQVSGWLQRFVKAWKGKCVFLTFLNVKMKHTGPS